MVLSDQIPIFLQEVEPTPKPKPKAPKRTNRPNIKRVDEGLSKDDLILLLHTWIQARKKYWSREAGMAWNLYKKYKKVLEELE